jgi:PPOX class probable F420-dependent enzyme
VSDDATAIPEQYLDILSGANTGVLVTLGPDGSPHAAPVWFLLDGSDVLVSTRAGNQKHRNMLRDPRVTFAVFDPDQPMHYVEIRGGVTVMDDPTYSARDAIVAKHGYPDGSAFDPPGAQRIVARITPHRIIGR